MRLGMSSEAPRLGVVGGWPEQQGAGAWGLGSFPEGEVGGGSGRGPREHPTLHTLPCMRARVLSSPGNPSRGPPALRPPAMFN